jgi:hypothetical protein
MTWPFGALTYSIDYVCVEGVSFPFSFQFSCRLAAVFADEVGGFGIGQIQRCSVFIIIWMPIGA